jgi:hypothetical protein
MNEEASKKRARLENASAEHEAARRAIDNLERTCQHDWDDVKDTSIYHKAYTIPGDPPGTMGVDRQLPCHVSARTEPRWSRTCKKCGKTEHTTRTKDAPAKKLPQF